MKIYGRIYLITNLINGKQYVGKTERDIKIRLNEHNRKAKNNIVYGMLIIKAIQKYNKENFKIEQIDVAYSKKELKLLEGVYISWFKTLDPNGYNVVNIINGRDRRSEKTKNKMKISANKPERLKILSENGKKCLGKSLGGSSKYCGVHLYKNEYISQIGFSGKRIRIGIYNLETDAAKAYDIKSIELFGSKAVLNFPELLEDYINNKVIVKAKQIKSTSGIKDVHFNKIRSVWIVKYFDKVLNKNKQKSFKDLEEAAQFKKSVEI